MHKAYRIFDPKLSKFKDFGFVEFKDPIAANKAFEETNHMIGTCLVTVHKYGIKKKLKGKNQDISDQIIDSKMADEEKKCTSKKIDIEKNQNGSQSKSSKCLTLTGIHRNGERKISTKDEEERKVLEDVNIVKHQQEQLLDQIKDKQINENRNRENDEIIRENGENNNVDAAEGHQDDEDDATPNQGSSSNKYSDLTKNLEIYTDKDRKIRMSEIVELSQLKQNEEDYYISTGVDISTAYRVNRISNPNSNEAFGFGNRLGA